MDPEIQKHLSTLDYLRDRYIGVDPERVAAYEVALAEARAEMEAEPTHQEDDGDEV